MPRFVAFKHPEWTGKRVLVQDEANKVETVVVIDGWTYGNQLVGHVPGTRIRWHFYKEGELGLPPWCKVIS